MSTDGAHERPPDAAPGTVPLGKTTPPVPQQPRGEPDRPIGGGQEGAGPPPTPAAPPLAGWLHTPRPAAAPGIWRFGHVPKPSEDRDPIPDRELYGGALLTLLGALLVWSLVRNGYLPFVLWPLDWTPESWRGTYFFVTLSDAYQWLVAALLAWIFGRLGSWPRVWRRQRPNLLRLLRLPPGTPRLPSATARRAGAALVGGAFAWWQSFSGRWEFWLEPLYVLVPDSWWENGDTVAYTISYNVYYALWTAILLAAAAAAGAWPTVVRHLTRSRRESPAVGGMDLTRWQDIREGGAPEAADRLTVEVRRGDLTDLDYARIRRAWQTVRARPTALTTFTDSVLADGPAAFTHPSGHRDLAVRTARHDLLTRQVLVGEAVDDERNSYEHRGVSVALDPATLGTSLLAVGPPGSGKTGRIIRPVAESLCLQALTGQAAVIAIGRADSGLGPDSAFDIIVRIGDPSSSHQLDPYGGIETTDEAAALLAEALTGDTRAEPRAAAAALAQVIGPYRAAYGHFPGIAELRALLDGAPALLATLAEDLDHAGAWDQQRELAARARQTEQPDDIGRLLGDRLAVLDRAGLSAAGETTRRLRPFSLTALDHPLRVRVDLPTAGHAEAARILGRLLLTQFTTAATVRADRSLFACLVLDDATAAITPGTVRGLTHLRPANAGAVLALRTLDEVPEALRTGLLGAVGCRAAFSGITTWDGEHFARTWGKEWTDDRHVTSTPDRSGGLLRRSSRAIRKLFTGRQATTETVTVQRVERDRWSASELAHRLPPRHAVLSLSTVSGESGPPVLVRLDS